MDLQKKGYTLEHFPLSQLGDGSPLLQAPGAFLPQGREEILNIMAATTILNLAATTPLQYDDQRNYLSLRGSVHRSQKCIGIYEASSTKK